MNDRSRPVGAAPETTAKSSSASVDASPDIAPHCCLDTSHAAFIAGWDGGYARGQMDASEDLARDWLHNLALEYAKSAWDLATKRHGGTWAEVIRLQAEAVD